ncbi:precorrin isomerase [Rubidibacter lacunae KORDI 51-2]|uniref:Precorrin isomerase n=1 Tax=Rubidibacter lacunae KORDI 51-2 TaxID=582515 RepID=U5DNB7_9CHRO|nr:precorrin-8X methylmutase [Rubidibacter lacunae]ERN42362.1 precorrin isomerase [Rubidibacter lacunae KORDI 51-2]
MDWHAVEARILSEIDRKIGEHSLSPAEYEIVRRIIAETADFDYLSALYFSERALQAGAAALAARSTIVVDVPTIQVGVAPHLQQTFANPIYCAADTLTRRHQEKIGQPIAAGMRKLSQRYPEGIFVVGRDSMALTVLLKAIASESIRPALVICTLPTFVNVKDLKKQLCELLIPTICTLSSKGGRLVAGAILSGLIDLAWQAYRQDAG